MQKTEEQQQHAVVSWQFVAGSDVRLKIAATTTTTSPPQPQAFFAAVLNVAASATCCQAIDYFVAVFVAVVATAQHCHLAVEVVVVVASTFLYLICGMPIKVL